jgi:hypothetical protein
MSLLTRSILRVTCQRFASTVCSNAQGIQDDPSLAADFIPDFTFPQGLQGDISDGIGNDAICQLWLQKCKLYGYDNCEERLQKLLNLNSTLKNKSPSSV